MQSGTSRRTDGAPQPFEGTLRRMLVRRIPSVIALLWLAALCGSIGCASRPGSTSAGVGGRRDAVEVVRIDYQGWSDAWALRNRTCELIVVPAVSRVMSFRLKDGPNLLWQDPALA